ncbi:MAG: hypothetical protein EOP84_26050, partial [Verrucomicrobiaceae bacterium]
MRSIRFWRHFPLVSGLCLAGIVLGAGVVTLLTPEIYESGMIMEIRPVGSEVEALKRDENPDAGGNDGGSPEYLMKAAEDLRGREMLGKIVDVLHLDRKWKKDRKAAVEDLREAVTVNILGDSSRVSIHERDFDKQDACAIVKEIGWYFKELRDGLARSELRQRLKQADQVIRAQEDLVEERRKILKTILRSREETDPDKVEWIESDGSDTNEESLEDSIKRRGTPLDDEDAKKHLDRDLEALSELSAKR